MSSRILALHDACRKGDLAKVTNLLSRGCDPNGLVPDRNQWSPLHVAAYYGHEAACNLLLVMGAEVNAVTARWWTPLMLACKRNLPGMVGALVHHGADLDMVDQFGDSALHMAAEAGADLCVRHLVEAGAYVNIVNHLGQTAKEKVLSGSEHYSLATQKAIFSLLKSGVSQMYQQGNAARNIENVDSSTLLI
mmetsp:Transcript_38216/g.50342  ORF Transcript_38216/g.50342 Transcript_38216/m.50342 type:complete len:192 (+) Transcript_38216:88-663(+)